MRGKFALLRILVMTTVVQGAPTAANIRNVLHEDRWRPYFADAVAAVLTAHLSGDCDGSAVGTER